MKSEKLDPAIENFIEEQKKKKKNFSFKDWLSEAAKKAKQMSLSSHPCKFSHPNAKDVTPVIAKAKREDDGFLRSGNVLTNLRDASANAAVLPVSKFLTLQMKDEKILFEHIKQGTTLAKKTLSYGTNTYEELREGFLMAEKNGQQHITSSKIKQVYFPIGNNTYHQLSILTPSEIMFELYDRTDEMRFNEERKKAKKCEDERKPHNSGYDDIYNLTQIGYGGSKPQNISHLNRKGKPYLLPSFPPSLYKKNVRLPKKDFFQECLWKRHYEREFLELHKIFKEDRNNLEIRFRRVDILFNIFDKIIGKILQIRHHENVTQEGNKHFEKIPSYQKCIIDNKYSLEDRKGKTKRFIQEIARWIVTSYEEVLGSKARKDIGDDEIKHFRDVLWEEKDALW